MLKKILRDPFAAGLNIDDPNTTELRTKVLARKQLLRNIYIDWYQYLLSHMPEGDGIVLELGAGAGFLKEVTPADVSANIISTDILKLQFVDMVMRAEALPFKKNSLKAILMLNVFHHIPDCESFFSEACVALAPGGCISLVEPWNNWWAKFLYRNLHHEPFDDAARDWQFPDTGPLSGANIALPWIVFQRDRKIFEERFPFLQIMGCDVCTPFSYLFSGGMTCRQLLPGNIYPLLKRIENIFTRLFGAGMFAKIYLKKMT